MYPIVNASGFLPVVLNFDIWVWLELDVLLGPLFNDHGFYQRSEGGHDAKQETAATSAGGSEEERAWSYLISRSKSQVLSTLRGGDYTVV